MGARTIDVQDGNYCLKELISCRLVDTQTLVLPTNLEIMVNNTMDSLTNLNIIGPTPSISQLRVLINNSLPKLGILLI